MPVAGVADEQPFTPVPAEQLLPALLEGGHVIYFRHAQTEKDYADQITADPNDGSTQRVLSEEGWNQSKAIGEAFRELEIPVGDVISSEYFRAWQTADLAFGRYEKNAMLNFLPFEDYTPEQVQEMRERVMPLVVAVPDEGVNTVIVAHDDPFEAVTGIYPEPQGVAYVLKPDGENFTILARLEFDEWAELDD
ncbi:MAG: histidine phosphatase family protein [Planctomycetota bacterium]